jgi:DNA-binding response OmpR family regulator
LLSLRALLEEFGYRALIAENGERAIEIYRAESQSVDLVILDMIMKGVSGRDTLRRLREIDPAVRVIISSGYDESTLSLQQPPIPERVVFLRKPFRAEELLERVAATIRGANVRGE